MFNKLIEVFDNINILQATTDTLLMVFISCFLAYLIGLPLGLIMVMTEKDGLMPCKFIHYVIGVIINLGRSIPFIILLIALIPFTRFVIGTSIGVKGMIVPLTIGSIPFIARLAESSFKEVDHQVIDMAKLIGCTKLQIVFKVYLKEALPSLIRGLSITLIMLVGYSAMSGSVGGNGLGYVAIMHGYYRFDGTTMLIILVFLIIIVQIIQFTFDFIAKKIDKKN